MRRGPLVVLAVVTAFFPGLYSQTTQGIILGVITDSATGLPVASAGIVCLRTGAAATQSAASDSHGNYALAGLSPAQYIVTVSAPGYQTQEARAIQLPVSGRIDLSFRLRPLYDLWRPGDFKVG